MSKTYRQDSRQRPELREIDPNNRLLAAQSPRRLEAESVGKPLTKIVRYNSHVSTLVDVTREGNTAGRSAPGCL